MMAMATTVGLDKILQESDRIRNERLLWLSGMAMQSMLIEAWRGHGLYDSLDATPIAKASWAMAEAMLAEGKNHQVC